VHARGRKSRSAALHSTHQFAFESIPSKLIWWRSYPNIYKNAAKMMQKIVVILAALLVSATAFTTGVRSARKSSIMMAEKSKSVPFLDLAPALSTIRSPAGEFS
jgi:hypothetical protein